LSLMLEKIFRINQAVTYYLEILLYYFYNILMDHFNHGSLGKLAMGIKVVGLDKQKPRIVNAVLRNFGKIISATPLFYGFLKIMAPHRWQTTHDKLSGCYVIKR
jgi:uncharacterized RDD family membrane protein YckC